MILRSTGGPVALLRRLSLRHLRSTPLRSGLVVLGIALGVAVVVAARATSDGMMKSFDEVVERIAGRADLMVVGNESGIPSSLTAEIAGIDGVEHAAAALEINTSFANDGQALLILGVDFLGDTHFLPFKGEGGSEDLVEDPLSFVNDPSAVLVTRTLARRRGLQRDSEIEVLSAHGIARLHVRGILEDSGPASSFGGQVAVMFLDAAQVTFARGMLVDRIDVAVGEQANVDDVQRRIEAHLGGRAAVDRPEQVGQRMRWLSEPLSDGLRMSGLVALIVGVFIIYNAIAISVTQRRKEVGVLRALGVLRRSVVAHFCLEAFVLAVIGVGLGLLLARELVPYTYMQTREAMSRLYGAESLAAPPLSMDHVLRGAFAGLVTALLSAYLPARAAARLDPVAALRGVAAQNEKRVPFRMLALAGAVLVAGGRFAAGSGTLWGSYVATVLTLAGTVLVAPFLVILLRGLLLRPAQLVFGLPGRLALDYVLRSLRRSTVNVLALMVAVALSVALGGWLSSFEQSVRDWFDQTSAADLMVSAGSPLADRRHMLLAGDTLDKLAGIDGIAAMEPMRMIEQRRGKFSMRLVASDTKTYLEQARRRGKSWRVVEGHDPVAPDALRAAPRAVLSENASYGLGLHAGDTITLTTPSGPLELEVWAVIVDYTSDTGAVFIDWKLYQEHWQDDAIDLVNLYLADGADGAAVADAVRRRLGGGKALFVTENEAVRDEFTELLNEAFSYTRALELIVLIIALLGVVGTMVAAVLDRTREIGMLRAVGATRRQVTFSIVVEAGFLGLCGVAGGVASGSVLSALFLDTLVLQMSGWHLDYVFPLEGALRIGVLVVLTSAAAGLAPGLRAARLEIRDALALE